LAIYIKKCERCGKEKEILINDGENIEEIGCKCGGSKGHSKDKNSFIDLGTLGSGKESNKAGGCCGGHCGTH
jgi:hypothetical protein